MLSSLFAYCSSWWGKEALPSSTKTFQSPARPYNHWAMLYLKAWVVRRELAKDPLSTQQQATRPSLCKVLHAHTRTQRQQQQQSLSEH